MQILSASQMVSQLKDVLFPMLDDFAALGEAQVRLVEAGAIHPASSLSLRSCIQNVMNTYIEKMEKALTEAYANGTSATINISKGLFLLDLIDRNMELVPPNAGSMDLEDQQTLVLGVLLHIDWNAIEESIRTQAEQLEANGLGLIADQLVRQLNMRSGRYPVEVNKRHVICRMHTVDYFSTFSKIRELQGLIQALDVVSKKTGTNFGSAVEEHLKALDALSYNYQRIASRTTFAKGKALEIVCFKECYEYRFSKPTFDALAAYITLYGNEDSTECLNEVLGKLQNAA